MKPKEKIYNFVKDYILGRDWLSDSGEIEQIEDDFNFYVDYRIREGKVEFSCPMCFDKEGNEIPSPVIAIELDYEAQPGWSLEPKLQEEF